MSEPSLTDLELACLRRLAEGDSIPDTVVGDSQTLTKLERLGYVERVVTQWLPLEMRREAYRLTASGRAVLSKG